MPGSRQQADTGGADQAWMPLRQRLEQLRQRTRNQSRAASRSVIASCILAPAFFIAIALLLFGLVKATSANGYGQSISDMFAISLGALACMLMILHGLFILLTTVKLHAYYYRQAWRHLVFSDLAVRIADYTYLDALGLRLNESSSHMLRALPKNMRLEQLLELKCGYFRAMTALVHGVNESDLDHLTMQGWAAYKNTWPFTPGVWKRAGCVAANLLMCGMKIPATAGYIYAYGPLFIASRAVLVAFLDFMLEEPPPWVDELTPPEDAKRPWWWRSVAPLLKG